MTLQRLAAASVAFVPAAWMAFDGTRALIGGSLVTPRSGPYAGQLGPWRHVVAAAGVDPAGGGMRLVFALYGWIWLAVIGAFLFRQSWSYAAMLAAALCALWFLPFGTLCGLIEIGLLLAWRGHFAGTRLTPRGDL